jgi:hypothetical protein
MTANRRKDKVSGYPHFCPSYLLAWGCGWTRFHSFDGDGAAALCEIRDVGDVTIAQRLDTAGEPDMPASAIASGCIDYIPSPENISGMIRKIALANSSGQPMQKS